MSISSHIMLSFLISCILTLFTMLAKQKFNCNFNSLANVECGFNSMNQKKFKFSNQFFMISVIFVIFDMELISIIPIPLMQKSMPSSILIMSIFLILSFSIVMEWMSGLIEWTLS